jgi:hypothetical protein
MRAEPAPGREGDAMNPIVSTDTRRRYGGPSDPERAPMMSLRQFLRIERRIRRSRRRPAAETNRDGRRGKGGEL